MICFNCGYKSDSDNIKQCPLCGMKFPHKCNECNSPNPLMAKFCFNCGTQISNLYSQVAAIDKENLSENRKNVAVIFADVSGFTALSEQMDPEGVREIINDCFDYITRPVYEFEGTIDKYIGDCVMILFGAKYVHHDDPKRAVLCAIKMQKLINQYSQENLSTKGINLEMSIGINYGLVVTGKVGNYYDKDYTVMGDVVNTAQRLQSNADKGSILVSESVYLETKDAIDYSAQRKISVKNKKNSVKCYAPINIISSSTADSYTLIGRGEEINILNQIYNDKGNQICINVIGDAGIGKTSILRIFSNKLGNNIKKVWVDCNSSYQNRVYYTIANIIFNIIDIHSNEDNEAKQNRLRSYANYIFNENYNEEDRKRNYDFIGLLIGIERDNDFENILNSMKYEDINEEILNQLNIFFEGILKKSETVIIIDGLHWADTSSLNILKEIIARNSKLRKMFIFSSRYELEVLNTLGEKDISILQLKGLKDGAIRKLACYYLNCVDIDSMVFDMIKQLTRGNPLYIIELMNSIKRKEQYSLIDGILSLDKSQVQSLPNNIEKLILENVSEYDDLTLKFLETASVIGKDFSLSWIHNLIEDLQNESEIIDLLTERNILSLSSVKMTFEVPDKIYKFNEDFTREVIYKSILNKRKIHLHKSIGDFIEKTYSKELENYYETLSFHYEKAQIDKKASKYNYKSAKKYKNSYSLKEALLYYEKYIDNVEVSQGTNMELEVTRALIDMGYIHTILTDYDDAIKLLNRALNGATLSDDMHKIKIMLATIHKEKGQYQQALAIIDEMSSRVRPTDSIYGKLLQLKCNILRTTGNSEVLHLVIEAEKILLQNRDFESLSEAMNSAGILYFIKGDTDNSTYYLNKAYEYAEKVNNIKIMSKISGNLGIIYHSSGHISKAIEYINKAIVSTKKISSLLDYVVAINNLGIVYLEKGEFEKAASLFEEVILKANEKGMPYDECIAMINLADLSFEKGKYQKAYSLYNQSNQLASKHSLPIEEGINYLGITKINFGNKKFDEGLKMLDKSYKIFEDADEITYICEYHRFRSVYELINLQLEQAMQHCNHCIELAIEVKSDYKKLKGLRLKGYILGEIGNYDEALNILHESIGLSYQLESNYELAKGYYQSFVVLYRQNLKQKATDLLLKAKEAIEKTDNNRWTAIINETLTKVQNDSYKIQFQDIS